MQNFGLLLRFPLAVLVLVGIAGPPPAAAWLYEPQIAHDQIARRVAIDPAGGVIVAIAGSESVRITKLAGLGGGEIWTRSFASGSDPAVDIAIDAQGDIALCSTFDDSFRVVKLSGATGSTIWETPAGSPSLNTGGRAVAFDANGDVLAAGTQDGPVGTQLLVVVKLDGSDGLEVWRHAMSSNYVPNEPWDLAVDAAGDVIAVGSLPPRVVKLSGASGAELWNQGYASGDFLAVKVDAAGDVFACGGVGDLPSGQGGPVFELAKFSGATGAEIWRRPASGVVVNALELTTSGSVVAAGSDGDGEFGVYRAAGATGALLWQRQFAASPSSGGRARAVALDAVTGDVYATGALLKTVGSNGDGIFETVKLSAADGTTMWHRTLEGTRSSYGSQGPSDEGFALAARPSGGVVAGGLLDNAGTKKDAAVYALTSGGYSITLKKTFKFKIGEVFEKKWLWGITADMTAAVPSVGEVGDPTREGAQLELRNPGTGESAVFPLPPGNWQALGRGGHTKGFKYLDKGRVMGPCSKVVIRRGMFVAACKSLDRLAPITLDETSQGSFDIALRLGNGDVYCWSTAGGEVVKDLGIAAPKRRGVFKARNAPEPVICEQRAAQ